MLILQVDGKMVITTLRNKYYHGRVFLLCMMDAQFIGGENANRNCPRTTESKYIALSTSMRELIPFMSLMKETAGLFGLLARYPVFRCTV